LSSAYRVSIGRVNNPKNAWLYNTHHGGGCLTESGRLDGTFDCRGNVTGRHDDPDETDARPVFPGAGKVHPASAAANKAINTLKLPDQCILVALIRKGALILPKGETVLQEADEVLALVKSTELTEFNAVLARAQ